LIPEEIALLCAENRVRSNVEQAFRAPEDRTMENSTHRVVVDQAVKFGVPKSASHPIALELDALYCENIAGIPPNLSSSVNILNPRQVLVRELQGVVKVVLILYLDPQ
jgi:hypothetical protein